jgi:hypothetical protein
VLEKAKRARDPEEVKQLEVSLYKAKKSEGSEEDQAKPIKPITRQHAAHVLSKLTGSPVDMHSLGPLSTDDIKYFKVADKRVMCVLLGTTPNQLLDSVVVDNTVKSFIGRNQIEKALMTARLAKDKGIVAMNRIMQHFLQNGKVNDALQIYSTRKKWGVPPNNQTLTVLFDQCSQVRGTKNEPGLTVQQVEKLQKILLGLKSGYKLDPNIIHINSAFSAFLNCSDQTLGFELWEKWLKKTEPFFKPFKPNSTTYTILLKALGHQENDILTMIHSEIILEEILKLPASKQDSQLYEAYVFAYVRCKRLDLIERGLTAAQNYFELETYKPQLKKKHRYVENVPQKIKLYDLKPLESKFVPSNSLIDILIKVYNQLGDFESSARLFKQYEENYPGNIDLPLIHRYLISIREGQRANAGPRSIEFYKSLTEGTFRTKVNVNSTTRFMVFNAIYSQSLTTLNDKGTFAIGKSVDSIYELANEFYSYVEKDVTSHELYGYLKAIRRLRLSKPRRDEVLSLIEKVKATFDQELQKSDNKRDTKSYISKVLETEKYLKSKQERKLELEKFDSEAKFNNLLKDGKGIKEEVDYA